MDYLLGHMDIYLQTSLLLACAAAYFGGLLVTLTPCTYPMIPITAGVIGNSNIGGNKLRGFLLSLCYVTGMAITYAALGIFAAATGSFFGIINSSPWTYLIVGMIIMLMGLSMLDIIRLPSPAPKFSVRVSGVPGVFVSGLFSGFIAGPCVVPVVGVLLAYVASTGNIIFGGLLLFIFAFGMGAVLLVVGTFSGLITSIPHSGKWMINVKKIMGLIMIFMSVYFLIKSALIFF